MNKPLAELEGMDGKIVYIYSPSIWEGMYFVDSINKMLHNKNGGYITFNDARLEKSIILEVKFNTPQKPSPRMVTLETAIKEGLPIKHIDSNNLDFMRCVFASILDKGIDYGGRLKVNVTDVQELLLNDVWEVKEG